MGGNALKHLGVGRKSREEFKQLSRDVLQKLEPFTKRQVVIPAYRDKEDYGDMDVLIVPREELSNSLAEKLKEIFAYREIKKNGGCWSYDYQDFQIDLLFSNDEDFDISHTYFSYNDLGNLVGRVAHKRGLKYGHKGLSLPIRSGENYVIGEVSLSKNPKAILEYLGYDFARFQLGFNNLQEIFEYTISSPAFDRESFRYENLNHINRVRNAKRPTFVAFVQWLEGFPADDLSPGGGGKEHCIAEAVAHFEKDAEVREIKVLEARRLHIKEKFSGEVVTRVASLTGKKLGEFICTFKKSFANEQEFGDWVIETEQAVIEKRICNDPHLLAVQNNHDNKK